MNGDITDAVALLNTLKNPELDIRLAYAGRWLFFSPHTEEWVLMERPLHGQPREIWRGANDELVRGLTQLTSS